MITPQLEKDLNYTFEKLSEIERKKFSNATILITGSAGHMGFFCTHFFYHFREKLNIKKVICLDNFILGKPTWHEELSKDSHFVFKNFDVIHDKFENIPEVEETDYVLHMASVASPTFYRKHPIETLDADVWGLRNLLEFFKDKSLSGFLFFSTSEIYGDPPAEKIPTDENYNGNVSTNGPRSCYDESKRFGETMCRYFAQEHKMPIGVVRLFNTYGPGMKLNDKRVPADFAKNIFQNEDIVILSDGKPSRTFCYIADAMAGCYKILLYGEYDYFNIGIDRPEISINKFAEICQSAGKKIFNYQGKVIYSVSDDKDYLTHNPQRRCPKIDKAKNILGYNPEILVDEGVERFLEFIKESSEENLKW